MERCGKTRPDPRSLFVYRSEKCAEAYVYLREQDAFDLLPEAVRASLWPPTFALSFELGPERRLARVDAEVVRANLAQDGFHVQLPPQILHLSDNRPAHAGNRLTQTDARGVTVTMQYDVLNRLTRQSNSADGELIVYRYDGAGTVGTAVCAGTDFSKGRLSQIEDALGSLSYCYDRRGNVLSKHRVGAAVKGEVPSVEWAVRYQHTLADQLKALQYPDGETALYHRDAAGRIRTVSLLSANGLSTQQLITQIDYAPFGPPTRIRYANGSEWARALDADYRIDRITAPGIDYDYSLDAVGNITDIAQGAARRSFEYDDLYRLTAMKQGASVLEGFGYDATGNRLSAAVGGANQTYIYPSSSHRLGSVAGAARSYTAAGNTALIGTRALEYSGFNRLNAMVQGGATLQSNAYSGRGERELRTVGATHRHFGYDEAGRLLFEGAPRAGFCAETNTPPPPDEEKSAAATQAKGAIEFPSCPGLGTWIPPSGFQTGQRILWLDDQPIALMNSAGAYADELLYVHADHLGSPRAITRPAAGNAVVWRWTLEGSAFGQHAALSDPDADGVALEFNLRYPGQYFDSATGLHYNYFRDYEAGTGRYVQSDPIGLGDGHSTYGYVEVTPLMGSDPLGLYRGPRQDWDPSFPKPLPQCKDNLFDPPKLPPCTWTYSKYRECVKYCIGALRSVEIAVASAALSTPDLLQRTVGSCWKLAKKAATTYTVATAGTCLFHCSMFPCAQDYQ